MKADVFSLLTLQLNHRTRKLLLPLLLVGAAGAVLLFAGFGLDTLPVTETILMKSVGAFLLFVGVGLSVWVYYNGRKARLSLTQLEKEVASLGRVHFERIAAKGDTKRFRVILKVSNQSLRFVFGEEEFWQLQSFFLETYPDITPTTLQRKLSSTGTSVSH